MDAGMKFLKRLLRMKNPSGDKTAFKRKRQWGTEKNMKPLSSMHEKPTAMKIALNRVAIILTIVFWIGYILSIIIRQLYEGQTYDFTMEAFGYSIVVSFLTLSALIYLITRLGALERFSRHERVSRSILDKYFSDSDSTITVLVPSYAEEPEVLRKTLISAALQEYPNIKVVLLIDDKPYPTDQNQKKKLEDTRGLTNEIQTLLSKPHIRFKNAFDSFEENNIENETISDKTVLQLAAHYEWAANWLAEQADNEKIDDHVDVFFADQVLRELSKDLRLVGKALDESAKAGAVLSNKRVTQLFRRLVLIFQSEYEYFERKKFASLSNEANKAMNLNSYIGLMGGAYRTDETPDGPVLVAVPEEKADFIVPDSEFVLTLDADSVLLSRLLS